jgi:hypothetical protein
MSPSPSVVLSFPATDEQVLNAAPSHSVCIDRGCRHHEEAHLSSRQLQMAEVMESTAESFLMHSLSTQHRVSFGLHR